MKKIGFVGAFEKTDLILYAAKILTELKNRILVVDTTTLQKARYIVPAISPTRSYVTTYEDIDVAVGFDSLIELKRYLGDIENEYEYMFIDADSYEKFDSFEVDNSNRIYFVTAFDSFSLKKGLEIIGTLDKEVRMEKIYFEREYSEEDDEYLNLLSLTSPVKWNEEKIYFPYDQGDLTTIMENQRVTKIKIRNLSEEYRQGLLTLVQEINPQIKGGDLKRALKNI